jgi:hypothetical protein
MLKIGKLFRIDVNISWLLLLMVGQLLSSFSAPSSSTRLHLFCTAFEHHLQSTNTHSSFFVGNHRTGPSATHRWEYPPAYRRRQLRYKTTNNPFTHEGIKGEMTASSIGDGIKSVLSLTATPPRRSRHWRGSCPLPNWNDAANGCGGGGWWPFPPKRSTVLDAMLWIRRPS